MSDLKRTHRIRIPKPGDYEKMSRLEVFMPYPIAMWLGCLDDSPCGRTGHDGFDEPAAAA